MSRAPPSSNQSTRTSLRTFESLGRTVPPRVSRRGACACSERTITFFPRASSVWRERSGPARTPPRVDRKSRSSRRSARHSARSWARIISTTTRGGRITPPRTKRRSGPNAVGKIAAATTISNPTTTTTTTTTTTPWPRKLPRTSAPVTSGLSTWVRARTDGTGCWNATTTIWWVSNITAR